MSEYLEEMKAKAPFDRKARAYLEDLAEAKRIVIAEARTENARRFKAKGIPLDIIAECTGLPLSIVEAM